MPKILVASGGGRHVYQRHWRRMAAAAGLSGTGTVRRVAQLVTKLLAELPAATEDVATIPTGAKWVGAFANSIRERAKAVADNALRDADDETDVGPAQADNAVTLDTSFRRMFHREGGGLCRLRSIAA